MKLSGLRNNTGQGLIEFALIIPLLLLILFGIIDFGRLTYQSSLLNHTAKESLRMISLGEDLDIVVELIKMSAEPIIGMSNPEPPTEGIDDQGNPCTVITFNPAEGYPLKLYISPPYNSSLQTGNTLRIALITQIDFLTPLVNRFANPHTMKAVYYTRTETPPQAAIVLNE